MKAMIDARAALAKLADSALPEGFHDRHSKLVAKYVAAAIREDRASRKPASLFDAIFGSHRL